MTSHQGTAGKGCYRCDDCGTIFFDSEASVEEEPKVVHANLRVDSKLIADLVDLAYRYASDRFAAIDFIVDLAKAHGLKVEGVRMEIEKPTEKPTQEHV